MQTFFTLFVQCTPSGNRTPFLFVGRVRTFGYVLVILGDHDHGARYISTQFIIYIRLPTIRVIVEQKSITRPLTMESKNVH